MHLDNRSSSHVIHSKFYILTDKEAHIKQSLIQESVLGREVRLQTVTQAWSWVYQENKFLGEFEEALRFWMLRSQCP